MTPEWSRPIVVAEIPDGGLKLTVSTSVEERDALSRRFGVEKIPELVAEVSLTVRRRGREVRVQGTLSGRVVQACVVTLEPVETLINSPLDFVYCRPDQDKPVAEIELDPESIIDIEPLEGDRFDLGESLAEQVGLEIPTYPKAPGVSFEGYATDKTVEGDEKRDPPNPFSVLAKLKETR
ncbi:DUF177 domain-containing protein [Magnetospira sp. QH-2]|uniref:DUF177 domain-containing protein n=1 Tax=Magnetospira sp. (strain QH-2) TaxID=1288970 RepID=UPI00130D9F4E|nr:DUF177 domain-containing protein [Magnetospira sp. QH-2]